MGVLEIFVLESRVVLAFLYQNWEKASNEHSTERIWALQLVASAAANWFFGSVDQSVGSEKNTSIRSYVHKINTMSLLDAKEINKTSKNCYDFQTLYKVINYEVSFQVTS